MQWGDIVHWDSRIFRYRKIQIYREVFWKSEVRLQNLVSEITRNEVREIGILLSVATALLGRLRHKDFNCTSSIFIWFHFASMQKPWQNTLCIPAKGTYAAFDYRREKSEYPARPVLDAKMVFSNLPTPPPNYGHVPGWAVGNPYQIVSNCFTTKRVLLKFFIGVMIATKLDCTLGTQFHRSRINLVPRSHSVLRWGYAEFAPKRVVTFVLDNLITLLK